MGIKTFALGFFVAVQVFAFATGIGLALTPREECSIGDEDRRELEGLLAESFPTEGTDSDDNARNNKNERGDYDDRGTREEAGI